MFLFPSPPLVSTAEAAYADNANYIEALSQILKALESRLDGRDARLSESQIAKYFDRVMLECKIFWIRGRAYNPPPLRSAFKGADVPEAREGCSDTVPVHERQSDPKYLTLF